MNGHGHRHLGAVGQHHLGPVAELLDQAEDVVPAARRSAPPRARGARTGSPPSRTRRGWSRSGPWPGCVPRGMPRASWAARNTSFQSARLEVGLELGQVEVRARAPRRAARAALWKKYRPKSNRLAEIGAPSTSTCVSSRCQPRGRTTSVAISLVERVRLAIGSSKVSRAAGGFADRRTGPSRRCPRWARGRPRSRP